MHQSWWPLRQSIPRSARDCTSHLRRATRHALRVPFSPHRCGDLHRPLGSAPDGIAQRAQGRVRVSVQERGEDGEDRSIRVVDHKRWEGVGRGGRKGQVWVVFWDQVDLCVRMVIARHTSTLQERWRWKDHHPYIAFRRLPVDALTVWNG